MTALNIIVIVNYPFEKHYILASLVKGEVLSPEKIRATTGGIVTPTLAHINPSKTALSLALHYHTCLPCQREVD